MAPRSVRTAGAFSAGASVSSRMCNESTINPTPIATRPRSRVRVWPPRLKAIRPVRNSTGATAATLNDSTWTMSVVPTLAPSITARAGTKSTWPAVTKEAVINPVAVLLCSSAVTNIPAKNAKKRLRSARPMNRLRSAPKARTIPLWTMCRPHNSKATPPVRSRSIMLPMPSPPAHPRPVPYPRARFNPMLPWCYKYGAANFAISWAWARRVPLRSGRT